MSFKVAVVRAMCKAAAIGSKHAPKIMVTAGVALMGVSAVVACKETTAATVLKEQHLVRMEEIRTCVEKAKAGKLIYTVENERKDTAIVYTQTALAYVRHYWKPIVLFASGAILVFGGANILSRRAAALTAAYAGLDDTFKQYRSRIKETYGEEADYNALHGFTDMPVTIVDEDGNEKAIQNVKSAGPGSSVYSILWDDMYSTEWTPNPSTNKLILEAKERAWTDVLHTRGFVHLDEVYRDLGVWGRISDDKMKASTAVGWVLGCGDDYVSFGLKDNYVGNPAKAEFINGFEPSVLLDFNIDGVIHDLL